MGLFILPLQAQQNNDLSVELLPATETQPAVIKLDIKLSNTDSDGLFIQLPNGMKSIVRSISSGEIIYWLKEGEQASKKTRVIVWQRFNNGLKLFFTPSENLAGKTITVEIVPDRSKLKKFNTFDIAITKNELKQEKSSNKRSLSVSVNKQEN